MGHVPTMISAKPRKPVQGIDRLIEESLQQLQEQGFAYTYVRDMRCLWRKFAAYAARQRVRRFSDGLAKGFLKAMILRKPTPIRSAKERLRRAMRILTEHSEHGFHRFRLPLPRKPLLPFAQRGLSTFLSYMQTEQGFSQATVEIRSKSAQRFLRFLERRGFRNWQALTLEIAMAYMRRFSLHAANSRAGEATAIRHFCRVLFAKGMLPTAVHDGLPRFRQKRHGSLHPVWSAEEIRKTLSVIDRQRRIGKRNYAILLLAARLGLRAGDIRNLRLENIHWESAFIEFVQSKTQSALRLPMPDDVGEALADYLRNGRPVSSYREVFLRHNAPHEPFGPHDNLYWIPTRHRLAAGLEARPGCGLHSLRHTLATRLLSAGANLESIAGILGHKSLDTTTVYLRFDIEALREVCLDPNLEVRRA